MKKELKYKIYFIPVFLLAAVSIPLLSWAGIFSLDESIGLWFQRSGSLMVLCAVIIEYILFKITIAANPVSGGKTKQYSGYSTSPMYLRYIQILKYITAAIAIVGTIIWGYGDLIYSTFMG